MAESELEYSKHKCCATCLYWEQQRHRLTGELEAFGRCLANCVPREPFDSERGVADPIYTTDQTSCSKWKEQGQMGKSND